MTIVLLVRLIQAIAPIATSNWLRDLVNWLPNPF